MSDQTPEDKSEPTTNDDQTSEDKSEPTANDSAEEFEVEEILDYKWCRATVRFLSVIIFVEILLTLKFIVLVLWLIEFSSFL